VKPVKIVTDSVADIPPKIIQELGITVIPVLLRFGEETFRDGIDITNDQFYARLVESKVMPTTSVPSLDMFARTYARLAEETDEILVIMLSSKLSGLYNAALQSAGLIEGNCRIVVVDSGQAVMAQGFVVIKAAEAARDGASLDEILEIIHRNLPRVEMRAAFDTLEFLKRGGRIGRAQAFMGSMLRVNPIITLKNGVVEPAGRARSRSKAIDLLYEFAAGYSHIEGLAVEEAACPEDADRLVERLSDIFPRERILRSRTTPVIGTHTGPGLLLVAVLGDKDK
jgi:DegV family protein with EDD domain